MLKRLTSKEVSIQFAPKLFTELKNESKSKIRDYFVFQEDAVRLIRYGIKYSSIYHNFIISGYDGLGKRTGILNLLQKEYPKKKVIYEPNPNFSNLFGFYENGEFIPGHLNSLNDGFLIIPLSKLLIDLHLYDFLKISLINKEINFKNLPEINYFKDFPRTTKPIQFQTRVILLSDDAGFEKILKSDSEVGDVFKLKIDLKYDEKLNNDNIKKFSNFIYSLTSDLKIKIDKTGIQKLLEEALILNESKEKFSLVISDIKAILEEAVLLANESKKKIIKEKEIEKALEFIKYRFGHPRRRYFEALKQKIFRIDLSGSRVGRINGLSIFTPFISFQEYGQISTISARVNMGGGSLINIEREVNFSGDLHDRGVFVLQSYLKGLFHKFQSLGMDISILFEQNHSIIDGDSASVAELIAVFSAISELPIPSNIAITGSLTQYGESLPVGAVIQKIESFFEITKLIGSQKETYKVFLPEQNIRDLILSKELRKYIEKGKFQIIAFSNVEEVVEEVFSIPFGKIGKNGKYQEGSFLKRIEEKLEKR